MFQGSEGVSVSKHISIRNIEELDHGKTKCDKEICWNERIESRKKKHGKVRLEVGGGETGRERIYKEYRATLILVWLFLHASNFECNIKGCLHRFFFFSKIRRRTEKNSSS